MGILWVCYGYPMEEAQLLPVNGTLRNDIGRNRQNGGIPPETEQILLTKPNFNYYGKVQTNRHGKKV